MIDVLNVNIAPLDQFNRTGQQQPSEASQHNNPTIINISTKTVPMTVW
jgi:hypothetical protein